MNRLNNCVQSKRFSTMLPTRKHGSFGEAFPIKLHELLEDAERMGFQDTVAWQSGGKSFKVLQKDLFSSAIMGRYFNQTKYKSFQRQLSMYGFRRIHIGDKMGGYHHPMFKRGELDRCRLILRRALIEQNTKAAPTTSCRSFFQATGQIYHMVSQT